MDVAVCVLLELTKKAIVDDARKSCVLEKRDSVDELELLTCFLVSVSSHGNIREDRFKVWLDDLVEKLRVCVSIEVFDENHFVGILTI